MMYAEAIIQEVVRVQTTTKDGQTHVTRVIQGGSGGNATPAPEPAIAPAPPIPPGGARLIVDDQGDRTVFTTTELSPQMMELARRAQETAFGLMGMLVAIVLLGPFVRMLARRIERKAEMRPVETQSVALQQQLRELQQSMDAMSVEVERISEAQRFQSKLLADKPGAYSGGPAR